MRRSLLCAVAIARAALPSASATGWGEVAQNSSSRGPPVPGLRSRAGYELHEQVNCFDGHGGVELSGVWYDTTAKECSALCDADTSCSCFVSGMHEFDGHCWKRASCDIDSCAFGDERFATYTKPGGDAALAAYERWDTHAKHETQLTWDFHSQTNCYHGHGASDLPGVWYGQSPQSCADICAADSSCDCFVLGYGDQAGKCWKRADCVVSACELGDPRWDTYTRRDLSREAPAIAPAAARDSLPATGAEESQRASDAPSGVLGFYRRMEHTSCLRESSAGPEALHTNKTAAQCAELCEAEGAGCACFVHLHGSEGDIGTCSMQHCNIFHCQPGSAAVDTYVRDVLSANVFFGTSYYYYYHLLRFQRGPGDGASPAQGQSARQRNASDPSFASKTKLRGADKGR